MKQVKKTKITTKGQTVIPKSIRTMFDLNVGDHVMWYVQNDKNVACIKKEDGVNKQ